MQKVILVGAVAGGLAAVLLGPLLGLVFVLLAALPRGAGMNNAALLTLSLALAITGVGFGLPLAWAGWRRLQGYPAWQWLMPAWGWLLIAFVVSLVLGQAALAVGLTVFVPIFHILAGALPALMFVSLTTHRGADLPPRQRIGSLAWGALGSTGLAIFAELMLLVVAIVAVAVWISVTNPQLLKSLQAMALEMQGTGAIPTGLEPPMDLFRSPLVAGVVLASIAVVVPLIEEAVKGLVVPLALMAGAVPSRHQAFLLGVVSGAGFALLEGILNGVMALMNPATWGGLMLVRGGTAAVHCAATGFVALGWYAILVEKRWLRGIGFGLLGVATHGAWNLAAGAETLKSLASQGTSTPGQGLLAGGAIVLMGGVWVAAVAVLFLVARRPEPGETAAVRDQPPLSG